MKTNLVIEHGKIEEVISNISNRIADVYYPEEITLLCCLKGALRVTEKLIDNLFNYPSLSVEFCKFSSYKGVKRGKLNFEFFPNLNLFNGKNVLIVEDIIDSGETMKAILQILRNNCKPKSVRIFALLQRNKGYEFNIDFSCFTISDGIFVTGFGLDYKENYRQLNGIYTIEK